MSTYTQSDTTPIMFLMIADTDHLTGKTGLSPTVTISKAGGAFGSPTGSVDEVSDGWYTLTPAGTDTGTLGALVLHAEAVDADDHDTLLQIIPDLGGVTFDTSTDSQEAIRNELDTISAKTDLLGTGVVTFLGPVISSDRVELVQGDDYLEADSQAVTFTSTDWPDLTSATDVKLSFRLAGDPNDTVTTITGSASDSVTVTFDITKTVTGAMVPGTDIYSFDVQVTLASASIKTLIDPEGSRITVKKQITT